MNLGQMGLGLSTPGRRDPSLTLSLPLKDLTSLPSYVNFTRSDLALYLDEDSGEFRWVPHNYVVRSEAIDHASWTKNGSCTATANATVAPNGTTTAELVEGCGASGAHDVVQTFALPSAFGAGNATSVSIYIKRVSTSGTLEIRNPFTSGNGRWQVDMSALSDSWEKLTATHAAVTEVAAFSWNASGGGFRFMVESGTLDFSLWGVHWNAGGTLTTYVPTTSAAVIDDAPRFGIAPGGTIAGIYGEVARTNICLYSQAFDTSWTTTRVTVSANVVVSPDGTTNADKIVEDATASASHVVTQALALSTSNWTVSVYAKAAERDWLRLGMYDGSANVNCYFDLTNGVVGTPSAGATGAIEDVGGGWYRCITSKSITDSGSNSIIIGPTTGDLTASYNGDVTKGIYVWQAQAENAEYPSTPIPTTTMAMTRNVERCWIDGTDATDRLDDEAMTMFAHATYLGAGSDTQGSNRGLVSLSDGSPVERVLLYNTSSNIGIIINSAANGGAQYFSSLGPPVAANVPFKISVGYTEVGSPTGDGARGAANGVLLADDTVFLSPDGMNIIALFGEATGIATHSCLIHDVQIYKATKKPDAFQEALTT